MKFMKKVKSLFILLALVLLTSCTFLEGNDEASVTFTIDRATASKIADTASSGASSRSIARAPTSEVFLDIELKGGYTASRTIAVTEEAVAQFDRIPVGIELYAEAVAYQVNDSGDKSRTILYSGKSETIKVKAGENTLNLTLKGSGSLSVTITIQTQENDLNLSYTPDGSSFVFSVSSEANSEGEEYAWYVDEKIQEEKSSSFTLETEGMSEGSYEISVACGSKSAMAIVTIE